MYIASKHKQTSLHKKRFLPHFDHKKLTSPPIMDIEIKISKNEIVRTTIIEPVKEPTMSALLTSLKSVKQQSNDTMTNFVNSEKTLGSLNCTSKRKDDDDDDEDESESK